METPLREDADKLTVQSAGLFMTLTFMSDWAELPKAIVRDEGSAERPKRITNGALHVCTK